MPVLLWDASALVKRFVDEVGTASVNALFAAANLAEMVTTVLGCAETYATLVRKLNQGVLDLPTFATASSALQDEVIYNSLFGVLALEYDAILAGIDLVRRHNINAADGAILTVYLRYARATAGVGTSCLLIASDRRLLRAAAAEGLATLDPEQVDPADVPALLAALP